jgi:hypothetical protein
MALTRIGEDLDFLQDGEGVIARTTTKRYASEVEVLNDVGGLEDVIYSGAEVTESTTKIGGTMGNLGADGSTVTSRVRVELSNEDVARTTTESLTFDF